MWCRESGERIPAFKSARKDFMEQRTEEVAASAQSARRLFYALFKTYIVPRLSLQRCVKDMQAR